MLFVSLLIPAGVWAIPLDGTWKQACQHAYSREESFQGAQAVYTERNFWDGACTQPAVEAISRGTIALGAAVPEPAGAQALDFVFESVSLRAADDRAAEAWREHGACGFRDWQAGIEKDVTGRECDFSGLGSVVRVPAKGDRKFGIVKAENGALYFGRLTPEKDGSSAEKRPLSLDPAPYAKGWRFARHPAQ